MSLNLVLAQVILLMLGLIGVATAAPEMVPDHASKVLIALLATFALSRLRPRAFLSMGTFVWTVTLILLVLVLVFGVGTELSPGVKRWLRLPGFQFQPSEFAKLGLILQLASFFSRRGVQHKLLSATVMIGLSTVLVLLEPDLGSTVLVFALGLVLMYAAGVKLNNIGGLLLGIGLLALPFVSYGFSSMLTMSAALALIHSALREVRRHLPAEQPSEVRPGEDPELPVGAAASD